MKKVTMFIALLLTLSVSANEPKPVFSKAERKIEKALVKIETGFKQTKDLDAAIQATEKIGKKYGHVTVMKVMRLLKTCLETCASNYGACSGGCVSHNSEGLAGVPNPFCMTACQQQYYLCFYVGCGGLWGN